MEKINFQDLPNTDTPIKASTLNQMQSNIEESCVAVSPTQPETNERVWIQKGKNLLIPFNKTAVISNDNDTFTFQADLPINWYGCIAKAELEANTEYTISCSNSIGYGRIGLATMSEGGPDSYKPDTNLGEDILHLFEASKNSTTFISNKKQTVYLMYCSDSPRENLSSFTTSIQLEQGSTATEYEAYIYMKIWHKNKNGVFEKVYDESEMNKTNYSLAEQVIGTWIDGKPLYRKTIPFTTGTSYAQWQQYPHGIPNIKHIMVTSPTYLNDGEQNLLVPDQHTQVGANSTYIKYVIATEGSGYGNKPIWVTVEYTKTTD